MTNYHIDAALAELTTARDFLLADEANNITLAYLPQVPDYLICQLAHRLKLEVEQVDGGEMMPDYWHCILR